jgi:hypothetical protein
MGAILWLASYPKSGNTWMRAFLHNLLQNPERPFDINQLTNFTLGESLTPWFKKLDSRPAAEYSFEEIAAMRPKVHRMMTEASADTVFAKIHNMVAESYGHPLVNMEVTAGAIYIVRNPLDVAISYAHHMGVAVDQSIDVLNMSGARTRTDERHVYEQMGSWTENVVSWTQTPMPQLHVVRFEDMLHLPLKTFGAVAQFLGFKPPRPRLEKAIRFSSFRVLRQQEQEHGFRERAAETREFFRKGETGQWRQVLSEDQVRRIVEAHREQMARFDYLPKEYK